MMATKQELEQIKALRYFFNEDVEKEEEDGTLESAKAGADRFTESTGITSMVIRKKNQYYWVSEYYFKTYPYKGKIYYKKEFDAEV